MKLFTSLQCCNEKKREITPVVLAGGVGTRLWPISRESLPKQFAISSAGKSLFARSLERAFGDQFVKPLIFTNKAYHFLVLEQASSQDDAVNICLEPIGKNTAPAIFAASILVQEVSEEQLVLVLPSDHYIPDRVAFRRTIKDAMQTALEGLIVTFGVQPVRPDTNYGYIELGPPLNETSFKVNRFHEKPNSEVALTMFESGKHLWNTGIFLFRADVMIELARKLQPSMLAAVETAVSHGEMVSGAFMLNECSWSKIDGDSIDYSILENADNVACVEMEGAWTDLGDWRSIHDCLGTDFNVNYSEDSITKINCSDSLLWSSAEKLQLVGLGLNDIIAVATDDAVLIAQKDSLKDMRLVVDALKENNITQADEHLRSIRPWGWFESLTKLSNYQVKRLHVNPGASLSLQSHKFRSEHWIVVKGTATVFCDGNTFELDINKSTYINANQKHRLSNQTDESLVVIEVQTGSYFGEDDIVRYEDIYGRTNAID